MRRETCAAPAQRRHPPRTRNINKVGHIYLRFTMGSIIKQLQATHRGVRSIPTRQTANDRPYSPLYIWGDNFEIMEPTVRSNPGKPQLPTLELPRRPPIPIHTPSRFSISISISISISLNYFVSSPLTLLKPRPFFSSSHQRRPQYIQRFSSRPPHQPRAPSERHGPKPPRRHLVH